MYKNQKITMPKNICSKCKKIFSSGYNLQQHIDKKIPCNIVIACPRCKKVFKYERELDKHLERKNPCKKITIEKDDLANQVQLLQIKSDLDLKNKIELEKEKRKTLEKRKELEKELMEKEKEIKLELIRAKRDVITETELIKSERKERTAAIINNTENINTHNTTIQNITNIINNNTNIINIHQQDKILEASNAEIAENSLKYAKKFHRCKNNEINQVYIKFISMVLNNDNKPDQRVAFYIKDEGFYIISDKKIKHDLFETHLFPLFKTVLRPLCIDIKDIVYNKQEPNVSMESSDNDNHIKYILNQAFMQFDKKEIEDIGKKALDIDNTIKVK